MDAVVTSAKQEVVTADRIETAPLSNVNVSADDKTDEKEKSSTKTESEEKSSALVVKKLSGAAHLHLTAHCPNCDLKFSTFSCHVAYKEKESDKLLGSDVEFCESFGHIGLSPEYNLHRHTNVSGGERDSCRMQCVTM